MVATAQQVSQVMGGEDTIGQIVTNWFDWLIIVNNGLPVQALRMVQGHLQFSNRDMSKLLSVSESTYQRRLKTPDVLLKGDEAEKTIGLSEVVAKGLNVFEDEDDFRIWLNSSLSALGGQTPRSLLHSTLGRQQVLDLLVRIEHGLYS